MSVETLAWLVLVAALAGLIQSAVGFGFGIVFLAMSGLLADLKLVSMVSAFVSVVLNGRLLLSLLQHIQWARIWPVLLAVLLATPMGVLLLQDFSQAWFNLLLGLMILWAVSQQLLPTLTRMRGSNLSLGLPMGFMSGLFTGAYNTGGPPLVVYVQSQGFNRLQQVASLQLLLLSGSLIRVEELWRQDLLTDALWLPVVLCCVSSIVGSSIGLRLLHRFSDQLFKHLVAGFLLLLAIFYISKWVAG